MEPTNAMHVGSYQLVREHPEAVIPFIRTITARALERKESAAAVGKDVADGLLDGNIRTVALIGSSAEVPMIPFAEKLMSQLVK
jgi:hypothetical protein